MAINETIDVDFNDGGSLNKLNKEASAVKTTLEGAAKASDRVAAPIVAARAGVSASNLVKDGNYSSSAKKGVQDADDSNISRGVAGQTGAAARDFAAQAKGLGGLVHVYATFAANVFAVSAAFTALSKAANVTNMIKGLDQLGAAAGKNLGTVAKNLTLVSDGALSLADSMTAVAQASSGGMSSQNIIRMGEVAKKASQALGRDMPDAINRLSRGITKIEPELLDELGIMVKVDEASRNYARSLGKTVASLSDFEKRQGYANAVLEEGERKFNNINLDSSPYQKILASINNLALAGGELVNKVLGPVLGLLAESPTALATVLAAITGMLVKQAIPALSSWRTGLDKAAESARNAVLEANKFRKEVYLESGNISQERADKAKLNAETAKAQLSQLRNSALVKAANFDIATATKEQLDNLKRVAEAEVKRTERQFLTNKSLSDEVLARRQLQQVMVTQLLTSTKLAQAEQAKTDDIINEEARKAKLSSIERLKVYFSEAEQRERIARSTERKSQRINIVNDAVTAAPSQGVINAWKSMNYEIANAYKGMDKMGAAFAAGTPKMTAFSAGLTFVRGTALLAAQGISVLAASLGNVFAIIGVFVATFMVLDGWLTKTSKQSTEFSSALDTLSAAGDNVDRTMENISKKKIGDILSIESVQAAANALNELTDSLGGALAKFRNLSDMQSGWDDFWDYMYDKVGKGSGDKLSKGISVSVIKALKTMKEGPAKQEAKAAIESIVGQKVDFTSIEGFNKSIKDLNKEVIYTKGLAIDEMFKKISTSVGNAASNLTGSAELIKEMGKISGDIITKLTPSDDFSKAGANLVEQSYKVAEAVKSPIDGLLTMKALAGDLATLSFLPPDTALELAKTKKELDSLAVKMAEAQDAETKATEEQNKALAQRAKLMEISDKQRKNMGKSDSDSLTASILVSFNAVKEATKAVDAAKANSASITTRLQEAASGWAKIGFDMFKAGTDRLELGLKKAFGEASITVSKTFADILKGLGGRTASIDGDLARKEAALQIEEINSRYSNTIAVFNLTQELQRKYFQDEKTRLESGIKGGGLDAADIKDMTDRLAKISESERRLSTAIEIANKGGRAVLAQRRQTANMNPSSDKSIKEEALEISKILAPLYTQQIGAMAQKAGANARIESAKVIEKVTTATQGYGDQRKDLDNEQKILETQQSEVANSIKLATEYNEILQTRKEHLNISLLQNSLEKERNNLIQDFATASIAIDELNKKGKLNPTDTKTKAELQVSAAKKLQEIQEFEVNRAAKIATLESQNQQDRNTNLAEYQKLLDDNTNKIQASRDLELNAINSVAEAELASRKALGYIQEEDLIYKTNSLALSKLEIDYGQKRVALEQERARAIIAAEREIKAARDADREKSTPESQEAIKSAEAKFARVDTQSNAAIAANNAVYEADKKRLDILKEQNLELNKQEEFSKNILSLTESLALVFGKVGAGIGGALVVLNKMATKETQYAKQKLQLEKERQKLLDQADPYIENKENTAELIKNAKLQKKLDEERAISELNNVGLVAAASKEMFEEKTAAYKALDVIQKVTAANSMALQVKQMATDLMALPNKVALGVAELVKEGGFAGFAGAAAFLALMASLGFNGGGSVKAPAGFTAEEQQKVQGTGRSYKDGKIVENGGGALGDSEKKSTAIVDGIELLAQNNFTLLQYTKGAMYDALVAIRDNTEQFVKLLVSSLRLGGMSTQNSSSKSFLGFSKSSTSVKDAGIMLSGSIAQLIAGGGVRQQYENVETKKSSWFGLKNSTKNKTNLKDLTEESNEVISGIFEGFREALKAATSTLGGSSSKVLKLLKDFKLDIKVSSLGKTGEEYAQDVMAAIGIQLDIAAKKAFPDLSYLSDKFQELGETTTDFVIRLVKTAEDVSLGLTSIGKTINKARISNMAEFSQSLVEVMGGVEEFLDKTEFFRDNFLTEAERLVPVQKAVTTELKRLGLGFVNTREEFVDVVQTLDLTTVKGRDTYAALMNVAEGFAKVYDITTDTTSAEEKLADIRRQYVSILRLERKTTKAVILERTLELAEMADYLRVGQKYIWAMEDHADLTERMTAAYERQSDKIKNNISTINGQIDALNKYKIALKTGNDSTLRPEQKYEITKSEYLKTLALATSVAKTYEQKEAKNQAISDLPNVANTFLAASKTLYSSSVAYTADFNSVLSSVTKTTTALEKTKSMAEKQLTVLEDLYDSFNIAKERLDIVAKLAPKLVAAQERVAKSAEAYYAKFPNGPAIPAPVTIVKTDNQAVINTLNLNNTALVGEIKLLKGEINILKTEAAKQTAALVKAVNNVSTTVKASVQTQIDEDSWRNWMALQYFERN